MSSCVSLVKSLLFLKTTGRLCIREPETYDTIITSANDDDDHDTLESLLCR